MSHQLIVLNEGALVEEELDALAGRELMASVLLVDAFLATSHHCLGLDLIESLGEGLFLQR